MMSLSSFTPRPMTVSFAGRSDHASAASSSSFKRPVYKPLFPGYESYQAGTLTPLLHACFERNEQKAEELLNVEKANPNTPNCYGVTPLMEVARKNQQSIARMLLQHPKMDISKQNQSGHTALMMGAQEGHLDIVKMICENALGRKNYGLLFKRNNTNETALDLAQKNGHRHVVDYLRQKEAEAERRVARHLKSSASWPGNKALSDAGKHLTHSTSMPHLKKVRSGLSALFADEAVASSSQAKPVLKTEASSSSLQNMAFRPPSSVSPPDQFLVE